MLGVRGAAALARALRPALSADPGPWVGRSTTAWLDALELGRAPRTLLEVMLRTATYSADFERQAADAALRQLRIATRPVTYVHGGWTVLVDGLAGAARAARAALTTTAPVELLRPEANGWVAVTREGP